VGSKASEHRVSPVVSIQTRLLAIVTGCFTALVGTLAFGGMFSVFPSVMVVGAVLQPRFRNLGRGLMLAGALFLSALVLPYGVLGIISDLSNFDPTVFGFAIASVLLVTVCDVVLVIEEVRIRRCATPDKSD